MYEHIKVTIDDGVATVTICRTEVRNAVNGPCAKELRTAFENIEKDDSIKVAVLTGEGGYFCAGADLKSVGSQTNAPSVTKGGKDGPMGPTRLLMTKPVIAAVAGPAVAGGLELALWCDLRVVEEDAYFGVYCRRFGVPLIDGGTIRLPRLIGQSRALDMILTGRKVDAREAYSFGLANRVVPSGQALKAAQDLAHSLTRFPQSTMRADRLSAYRSFSHPLEVVLQQELDCGIHTLPDAVAGAKRFMSGVGRGGEFSKL
eukprot:TRINITY_DN8997_c1_g2_i1.p1 TRINITY_DN8997_c1_g2~~TRINITY_DN8997_c1_g2_i1.p1  ORF type:complete len:259 (+),score=34.01 TRINITY_DN8997_c1_g2_i1:62-838(+)